MKTSPSSNHISRREFLVVTGLAATALATGCKRGSAGPEPGAGVTGESSAGKAVLYAQAKLPAPPAGTPDLILRNGKVITVDAADTIAQALAVKGGSIQAVGSNEAIDALKGPETQVVDLNGRSLTPGLIDPHYHLGVVAAMQVYTPFLQPEVKNVPDMQKKLKEVAAQTPKGQWIFGYFFLLEEGRAPYASELDASAPDNPVFIIHQGGHFGSGNTLALQAAGVTKDTPDPVGAVIERDKNGEPTGAFYNHRALDVLRKGIPPELIKPDPRGLVTNQPMMAAVGLTTFHDVYVRGKDILQSYYNMGANKQMLLRGAIYPILEYPKDIDAALSLERYKDDMFRLGGFKLQIDGQGPTAYTNKPHDGISWDMPSWEPNSFKETVRRLHEAGLQISTHCIGDAAVDLTLDAYEEAMNASPRPDPRHRIEHCILSTQESHQRMKDLGVVVSCSPSFLSMSGDYYLKTFKGQEDLIFTERDWLEKGLVVTFNSDYPTTFWAAPMQAMSASITRLTQSGRTANPDQAVTVMEALRAHTMGAAYAGFDEGTRGSVEPGKLADLAVWTKDPLSQTGEEIAGATIEMTFIGGRQVYPEL